MALVTDSIFNIQASRFDPTCSFPTDLDGTMFCLGAREVQLAKFSPVMAHLGIDDVMESLTV